MNKVLLKFSIVVDIDDGLADELGEYIAHDVFCEMFNGEDVFSNGHHKIS